MVTQVTEQVVLKVYFGLFLYKTRETEYKPRGQSYAFWERLAHAAVHNIITERRAFNWSSLPASAVSAGFSNAYQPAEQQTWAATAQRFGTMQAGYAFGDLYTEFHCDLKFIRGLLRCKD